MPGRTAPARLHSRNIFPPRYWAFTSTRTRLSRRFRSAGFLDLSAYGVVTTAGAVLPFFLESSFLISSGLGGAAQRLAFAAGRLDFRKAEVNSYFASVSLDFLRQELLQRKVSFTFETVMSHPSKVTLLEQAQRAGFRTYLYYIATDDPAINISRVRYRVKQGGHAAPEDKIVNRYHRSLRLLMDAIRHTNRAYIFDNSGENQGRAFGWRRLPRAGSWR